MSLLDPPVRSTRSVLHHDFSNKANGIPSNTMDSGQTATQWTLSTTSGVADRWNIVSGRACLNPYGTTVATSDAANHAVYMQVNLGAPVTHVKVPVKWPAGSAGGSQFTIVLPSTAWGLAEGLPRAGVHVGFSSNGQWNAQEWNAGVRNYATDAEYGRFTPMFTSGVEGTFELFIDRAASTLSIVFPDGKVVGPIYDASIALYTSTYVVFELFVSSVINDIPPSFGQITADTLALPYDSRQLTLKDVITLFGTGRGSWSTALTTTSATTLVLTNTSANVQSFAGSANQTVTLPAVLPAGFEFIFSNASTGFLTINASNGSNLGFVFSGAKARIISTSVNPIASSSWTAIFPVEVGLAQTESNKTFIDAKMRQTVNAQTGTTYTLVLTDASKIVTLTNASAIALTIPTNASVAMSVGSSLQIAQGGAGQVTIAGAGGVTVLGLPGLKTLGQGAVVTLYKVATDTWYAVAGLVGTETPATKTRQPLSAGATLGAVAGNEYTVLCSAGAAPTLPTAVGNLSSYILKNLTGSPITVATTSSQTIQGGTTTYVLAAYEAITVVSDNANWVQT